MVKEPVIAAYLLGESAQKLKTVCDQLRDAYCDSIVESVKKDMEEKDVRTWKDSLSGPNPLSDSFVIVAAINGVQTAQNPSAKGRD